MHIPEWFTFSRKKTPTSPLPVYPEVLGPSLDTVPLHHQNLVRREEWGAEPSYRPKPRLEHPIKWIKLTYSTFSRRCFTVKRCIKSVRNLQLVHINKAGIDDIQYNFMIGGDARVYEGRGWHLVPENERILLKPWQDKFLEIAFIGDDKGFKIPPSHAMYRAAWEVIQYGLQNKFISEHYKML
ncbi:peptidoglycan recognition protein 3-like [Macrosteles quadrilineatus]|uniref:peptidoglycan recognition protein 3-like n=1 Tax=Macrosteles quadrilineatus TaxID=74068 RepID=UPI0023E221AC|nr:peptidoglycan recognition protein 3-like [Macrosteles quadrilineatus]